jgi:hypothetical protein
MEVVQPKLLLRDDSPRRTLKVYRAIGSVLGYYLSRETGSGYNVRCRHHGFVILDGHVVPDGGKWPFRVPQTFLKQIRSALA